MSRPDDSATMTIDCGRGTIEIDQPAMRWDLRPDSRIPTSKAFLLAQLAALEIHALQGKTVEELQVLLEHKRAQVRR
jgi:hypothetical protein